MLDPQLEPEARRLALAAALTGHMRRSIGQRVPRGSTATDVLALAKQLSAAIRSIERTYGVRFDPAYPGATAGPETIGDSVRLVLACAAIHANGSPIGIVFTTLIAGRQVQVSVAPSSTSIPAHWRPLEVAPHVE